MSLREQMARAEESIIRTALDETGSIHAAAITLGIHRNTLSRKLIKFGITDQELYEYRHKHDLAKYGTGWSANGRDKLHSL